MTADFAKVGGGGWIKGGYKMKMNKIKKILEKLYWLKTHNKNLTKQQQFLIEEIYDELNDELKKLRGL